MKNKSKFKIIFTAVLVTFGLISGTAVLAGKYAREPEKCEAVCQRKAEEAQENKEARWDAYVATAAAAAPYTPLAATYQNKIIPGMIAAYKEKYAGDISSGDNFSFTGAQGCGDVVGSIKKCLFGTLTELSSLLVKEFGVGSIGNLSMLYQGQFISLGFNINAMSQGNVPVIYNNGRFCVGWLGCYINVPKGGGGDNNGSGNGNNGNSGSGNGIEIRFPTDWTPLPSRSPSPAPTAADITKFEITNFRLQTALNGVDYYQILKEQMAINYPNYQLNLAWGVSGANSCQASCKYVKIDDYLANQNWDELQAQSWPCSQNIDNQTTFSGDVDKEYASAKTKPRENGIIRYTLSCQGDTGSDRKDLLAVIQSLQWFEAIPIIDQ